jgi:cell division protein ZapA
MAALTVSDQLTEAMERIRRLEEEVAGLQEARASAADRSEAAKDAVATALNAAAERIERVTKGLNQSLGNGVGIG